MPLTSKKQSLEDGLFFYKIVRVVVANSRISNPKWLKLQSGVLNSPDKLSHVV
jgi:hypothetical protein